MANKTNKIMQISKNLENKITKRKATLDCAAFYRLFGISFFESFVPLGSYPVGSEVCYASAVAMTLTTLLSYFPLWKFTVPSMRA